MGVPTREKENQLYAGMFFEGIDSLTLHGSTKGNFGLAVTIMRTLALSSFNLRSHPQVNGVVSVSTLRQAEAYKKWKRNS